MDDTTALSYWLNWRFFLCALWVLIAIIAAGTLITKYEVVNKKSSRKRDDELDVEPGGILYEDETWRSSIKALHPAWLLSYRLVAFGVLLSILVSDVAIIGAGVLFFYTQWTFALLTFYFALASSLSIYGCYQYWNEVGADNINHVDLETEQSTLEDPLIEDGLLEKPMKPRNHGKVHVRKTAVPWGYFCQIVFQICAGSVGLTDSVFWLIIYPFLSPPTYQLTFLHASMHSVNAVLLLIEVFLNRLVAIYLPRLVISICSYLVSRSGINSPSCIRYLCAHSQVEAVLQILPEVGVAGISWFYFAGLAGIIMVVGGFAGKSVADTLLVGFG
ncbi:hypothetical protein Tco_0606141 [Tanacetum coccineum]